MELETGTDSDVKVDVEIWKNLGDSTVSINKIGPDGKMGQQSYLGRQEIRLTRDEREMNENAFIGKDNNFFRNGMLEPVRIFDEEAKEEFTSNPNLMSEDEMKKLVNGRIDFLKKRIADINSPILISKLLEVANAEDVTVRKVEALEERNLELNSDDVYIHRQKADSK